MRPPEDCEYLLEKLCDWLNGTELQLEQGNEIICGIIRAIVAHIYFVWIHPFGDGNGRTARLLEVKLLLDCGVPSDAAHLLSNYYNKTRSEYYRQLDVASKHGGNILPFIEYAVTGLIEELREQIGIIREQHAEVTWVNYVYDVFRDKKSIADRRRRLLVLAMSGHDLLKITELPKLSAELAAEYSGRTPKTIVRDVTHLVQMGLVVLKGARCRANKEAILSFLPTIRKEATKENG
jgi:Fic family protein